MNLQDKTILITGASKGLGFELSKSLWEEGANLFLISRTRVKSFKKIYDNQKFIWYECDLSKDEPFILTNFCDYSKIDIIINNAGIQIPIGNIWETNWEDWKKCLNVNLFSPIKIIREYIPQMILRKSGKIINISGGGATSSRPQFSAYATAKTGLVRFTEVLADEVQQYKITANCVSPGIMKTDLQREILASPNTSEEEKENAKKILESNFSFEKPIALIKWLISDDSNHVTGRIISAQWDNWETDFNKNYIADHFYKLRRSTHR